jgi:hypothetical protein
MKKMYDKKKDGHQTSKSETSFSSHALSALPISPRNVFLCLFPNLSCRISSGDQKKNVQFSAHPAEFSTISPLYVSGL